MGDLRPAWAKVRETLSQKQAGHGGEGLWFKLLGMQR
jgi:hypothetical protein